MIDALIVAKEIISYSAQKKRTVTNLSLQKLAYFCHGWHLAITGDPLIKDEEFRAWQYGPVLPSLYHKFKFFSASPIPENAAILNVANDLSYGSSTRDIVHKVLNVYGSCTPSELVQISHLPDSPWSTVWFADDSNEIINNDMIRDYFSSLATSSAE